MRQPAYTYTLKPVYRYTITKQVLYTSTALFISPQWKVKTEGQVRENLNFKAAGLTNKKMVKQKSLFNENDTEIGVTVSAREFGCTQMCLSLRRVTPVSNACAPMGPVGEGSGLPSVVVQ